MKINFTRTEPNALRRKLMFALPGGLALASPMALVGCGGGGGDATGSAAAPNDKLVQAQMAMPAAMLAAEVTIVSHAEEVQPASDGKFRVAVEGTTLSLLSAVHGSGRVLLFGLFAGGATGKMLDAQAAAAAMLFFALGGSQLSAASRQTIHGLVLADTQTTALAAAIQQRLAADPFALDDPDAQVLGADRLQRGLHRAGTSAATLGEHVRRLAATDVQPLLRIEPGGEVNGISVNQGGDTPGYSIVNTKRRRGLAHLYKVGYKMPDVPRFDLALAEATGTAMEIDATESLNVFSALSGIANGTSPLSPVTSQRTGLPMHPGAEETYYELVFLTPVYDRPEPAFFFDVRYTLERATWRTELEDLYMQAQLSLVFGAVLEALGFGGVSYKFVTFQQALTAMRAAATGDVLELLAAARAGDKMLPGLSKWLVSVSRGEWAILGQNAYKAGAAVLLRQANAQFAENLAAGGKLSRARAFSFGGAMRVFIGVTVVAGVFDTTAQYRDLHDGEKASLFTATLVAPKVFVSPSSGTVGKGQEQVLTARVSGAQGIPLTYRWTLAGSNLANLSDKAGKIGTTIDTDKASVTLATTPSTVGTLTITVEAFQVKAGGNVSLGTATSQLLMDDSSVALTPASARIERVGGSQVFTMSVTPTPVEPVSYEWSCPSQWGSVTSGGLSTAPVQQTITSTQATATYAGRANLDGGESESLTCVAKVMREDPATGAPVVVIIGTASAEVSVKQKFNVELVSLPAEVPADNSFAVVARITDPVPAGATIEWSWLHSGVGSITTSLADANKPNSSVQFNSGPSDGLAIFTVSARVTVPGQPAVPALPVTRSTNVKKGLRQIVFEASGGVFGCSDPLACGVSEYTAFVVPRFAKATQYSATLSGFAFAGCNRTVTWNSVVGDGGGCSFPVTYFPHSSVQPTNAWAVWIGFGGPLSGKCVVTVTLSA
jgi:hypothetical protein